MINNFSNQVLKWYAAHGNHKLPWRRTKDPYKIWISEIMLQQTQVQTVIPYYNKWNKLYPSFAALSKANLDSLLLIWQGLGYYKRVENILNSSKIITNKFNNIFPNKYDKIIQLPGIGDYTASAILTIAFNQTYIPIDSNLRRIFTRMHMLPTKLQSLQKYKKYGQYYINKENPGDAVQALMDIGRTICKAKKPLCKQCPLAFNCKAYIKNKIALYSIPKLKKIPTYKVVVGCISKKNQFIITKRNKNKLLGNLWELPGGKLHTKEKLSDCLKREINEELNIKINNIAKVGIIKHQYSHFKIIITLFRCKYKSGEPRAIKSQAYKWIKTNQIKSFAFPSATHKLFKLINKNNESNL